MLCACAFSMRDNVGSCALALHINWQRTQHRSSCIHFSCLNESKDLTQRQLFISEWVRTWRWFLSDLLHSLCFDCCLSACPHSKWHMMTEVYVCLCLLVYLCLWIFLCGPITCGHGSVKQGSIYKGGSIICAVLWVVNAHRQSAASGTHQQCHQRGKKPLPRLWPKPGWFCGPAGVQGVQVQLHVWLHESDMRLMSPAHESDMRLMSPAHESEWVRLMSQT